jgi:DNA-binding transcriptional regulator PaaX
MAGIKRQKSFARKLLKLIAISGAVLVAASSPYFGLNLIGGIQKEIARKKWRQFYNDLYRLKRQKRLNVLQKPNGAYEVTITNLGSKIAKTYELDDLKIKKPDQWDGFWRFIAFDIPSKNPKSKLARHSLLKKLKELDFIMVQRSLWAHPYECREELGVIAKAFEVEPYVRFFVAHDFDKSWELRDKFQKQNSLGVI